MQINIYRESTYKDILITEIELESYGLEDMAMAILKNNEEILAEVELYLFFSQVEDMTADEILEDIRGKEFLHLKTEDLEGYELMFSKVLKNEVESFSLILNIPEVYENLNTFYSFTFKDGSSLAINENELAKRCKIWMYRKKHFSVQENENSVELIGIMNNVTEGRIFWDDGLGSDYPTQRIFDAALWVSDNY